MAPSPRPVQICFGSWVISLIQWSVAGILYAVAIQDGATFECNLTDGNSEFVEVLGVSASFLLTAFSLISKLDGKDGIFVDTMMVEFKPSKVSELFVDASTTLHIMTLTECNKFVSGPNVGYATGVMGTGPIFDYSLRGHVLLTTVKSSTKTLWEAKETFRGGQQMALSVRRYGVLQMEQKEEPEDMMKAGRAVANLMRSRPMAHTGAQRATQNIQTMAADVAVALTEVARVAQWDKAGRQMLMNDPRLSSAGKYVEWIVG